MKTLVYFSLLLVISFIVISCKKESPFLLRSGKSINSIDYIQNQFLIFKESIFSFTSTIQDRIRDYYKNETFKGKLKIKNV
ncbi:hypothetical protein [Moheibacter sediminis]|uniref:Uncharacterized protein n=1 Tax=Moheibacter sediminis TaxID=1434700 RepID=A0A1W2AHN7_9FLAO|nr:hypothetical protein [Moheibacter sediminis]SMC60080.1 hypothetical protein SAMN06296427_104170 [Moheibacter sediminis]